MNQVALESVGHTPAAGPPAWLVAATGLLALGTLAMAVAETNLWLHYVIDAGESISLVGLAFMLIAGVHLHRRGRLWASLPLALPWLLFPVITQGDQIIDHLSINWMRAITHVLLGALFGFPVAVAVTAARSLVRPRPGEVPPGWMTLIPGLAQLRAGRTREGATLLAVVLLVLEMWVAVQFLGLLMVVTLILMIWVVLFAGFRITPSGLTAPRRGGERLALVFLLAGVVTSLGLFVGYKNRPGAYQGSPSHFMDPARKDAGFQIDRIAVPAGPAATPPNGAQVAALLTTYGRAFERLLAGYYILDRNYNYDFHNRLFLRQTPLLPDYRAAGLRDVATGERLRVEADAAAAKLLPTLAPEDPLRALLEDVKTYAAFTFDRAPTLERMSAEFEQTQAGLQHATHLYEGEGKMLGVSLAAILDKHRVVLHAPATASMVSEFTTISRAIHVAYANRIVGF